MTVSQAILEELKPYPVRERLVDKKCIDQGIASFDEYSKSNQKAVTKVVISVLTQYLSLGSINEGGVSISFNVEELKAKIALLKKEIGEDSEGFEPTVKMIFL